MTKTIRSILSVTTISSIALVGLVIFASGNFIQESHEQVTVTCENTFLPLDPLEVNVVITINEFVTYIVEKETFDCVDSTGDPFDFVREVAIVLKTRENKFGTDLDANGGAPGKILITVIQCDKSLDGLIPNCIRYTPGTSVSLVDCLPNTGTSFLEMDSNSIPFGTPTKLSIKTVIVEKEIHECNPISALPTSFGEVFNIEEFINSRPPTQKAVICEKEAISGRVLGCIETPVIVL